MQVQTVKRAKLVYPIDILWVIGWLAACVGAFWIWQNYKSNLTETLFMTLAVCVPSVTALLVIPRRFFEWDREKRKRERYSQR